MDRQDETRSILSYFGLREQPFAATADPSYFYATREHKECLFRLWSSVDERHGIAVILGSYGTGKTTLLRKLLTGMRSRPEVYNTAVLGSPIPSWTSFSLLEAIVTQFGLSPERRSFASYMEALNRFLLGNRSRITTLIIDDAQNLNKRGQLELLRLAQNLETPQHKLLNLVCFAQLEWTPVLKAASNFAQRVNMTYTLGPLSMEDTAGLISFRLRQAGAGERGPIFEEGAVRVIHAHSLGSPRETVTLCRNALLLAAHLKSRHIGQAIVMHTIEKTTLPDEERRRRVAAVLAGTAPTRGEAPADPAAAGAESRGGPRRDTARADRMLLRARQNPDTSR